MRLKSRMTSWRSQAQRSADMSLVLASVMNSNDVTQEVDAAHSKWPHEQAVSRWKMIGNKGPIRSRALHRINMQRPAKSLGFLLDDSWGAACAGPRCMAVGTPPPGSKPEYRQNEGTAHRRHDVVFR